MHKFNQQSEMLDKENIGGNDPATPKKGIKLASPISKPKSMIPVVAKSTSPKSFSSSVEKVIDDVILD